MPVGGNIDWNASFAGDEKRLVAEVFCRAIRVDRRGVTAHHGTVAARSQPAGGLEVAVLLPGVQAEGPAKITAAATAGQP